MQASEPRELVEGHGIYAGPLLWLFVAGAAFCVLLLLIGFVLDERH